MRRMQVRPSSACGRACWFTSRTFTPPTDWSDSYSYWKVNLERDAKLNAKLIIAGNWSVSCQNTDHFTHGLKAIYTVKCCEKPAKCKQMADEGEPHSGTTRVYYIAAVLKKWNYSPKTIHPLTGEDYSLPNS